MSRKNKLIRRKNKHAQNLRKEQEDREVREKKRNKRVRLLARKGLVDPDNMPEPITGKKRARDSDADEVASEGTAAASSSKAPKYAVSEVTDFDIDVLVHQVSKKHRVTVDENAPAVVKKRRVQNVQIPSEHDMDTLTPEEAERLRRKRTSRSYTKRQRKRERKLNSRAAKAQSTTKIRGMFDY